MAHFKEWLPGKRVEQLAMAKIWSHALIESGEEWKIPSADIGAMEELTQDAEIIFNRIMAAERNTITTARCNETFGKLITHMRYVKNRYFFVPPLAGHDLVSLGLRPHDTARSPVSEPEGQASAEITFPGPHLHMLHMKHIEGTRADPRADHGFRIYFGIMPHGGAAVEEATGSMRYLMKAPASGEELPHSKFTRRRKMTMEFPAQDSGKAAYYSIRLENAKGGKGPWGPLFSAVIP